jgi:hypothetical protein
MKNILSKYVYLSLFLGLGLVISSCSDDKLELDASKVIPLITSLNGAEVVFQGDVATYSIALLRGGSEYVWTVTGAVMQPIEGKTDEINVLFNQFALPVSIQVIEVAANGLSSDPVTLNVTVFGTPCDWTLEMQDSWGDGWNGASVTFAFEGTELGTYTINGPSGTEIIAVPDGGVLDVSFSSGAWDGEITYQIYDSGGILVFSDGPSPAIGADVFSATNACAN